MSAGGLGAMSNHRLMELFAVAAKRFGGGIAMLEIYDGVRSPAQFRGPPPAPKPSRDTAELEAAGTELRARKAIWEIRRLLADDNPDVRLCAAIQFASLDPEWTSAAIDGLFARLSTPEVLAMRLAARQPPPALPTLAEMSDEALVARFEDAAKREYAAAQFIHCEDHPEDMEVVNRIVGEIWDIMRELKSRGALDKLRPLLESPNITVRREAATACLRVDERRAIAALEDVAENGTFEDRLPALQALNNWRTSGFAVYGV